MTKQPILAAVRAATLGLLTAFAGPAQAADPGRVHIMDGLADPEVVRDGDRYLLTGTWAPGRNNSLKIWQSSDLTNFRELTHYQPTKIDPDHGYCRIWAPDISVDGDQLVLSFSAMQYPKGGTCPPIAKAPSNQQVTTWVATSPRRNVSFGVPKPINAGTKLPRSFKSSACPPEGCNRAIRIDSSVYDHMGGDWFFYTWFTRGNNIAAFPMSRPDAVYNILTPFSNYDNPFSSVDYEESINEAPDVISHNGLDYLIYSRGNAHFAYGLSYLVANGPGNFSKARGVRSLSTPVFAETGPGCTNKGMRWNYRREPLLENLGHSAAVEMGGRYYIFYHVGEWTGENCTGFKRNTYRQALTFKPDGTLESLTDLFLVWPRQEGHSYSIDVRLKNGRWIAPCVGASTLGQTPSYRFTGACPTASGKDRRVHKSEIAEVKLVMSSDGNWSDGKGESARKVSYSGGDYLYLGPPAEDAVSITWTETGRRGEDFSLDVMLKNGRVVAGCFGPGDLGHADAVRFAGTCRDNARSRIALNQIAGFRVCSSAAWMGAVRQNDICVREGYRPGQQRVHVDMGGG